MNHGSKKVQPNKIHFIIYGQATPSERESDIALLGS